jgi:hypothetical protein
MQVVGLWYVDVLQGWKVYADEIKDLATYRITALEPALRVEEAAVGSGDICGSVLLNRRFLNLVEERIGPMGAGYVQDVCHAFLNSSQRALNDPNG